jgi:polyisoprenoid-binding protein YceI
LIQTAVFLAVALLLASCQRVAAPDASVANEWHAAYGPPPGKIVFEGGNAFRTVRHEFTRWRLVPPEKGNSAGPGGGLELEIDMTSIETGNERMNRRSRSPEFFGVAQYPTARMRLKNLQKLARVGKGPDSYTADVEIDYRDSRHSLPIRFEVIDPLRLECAGHMVLSRSEFGLGPRFSRFNPFSIRDALDITFTIRFPMMAMR